MDRMQQRDKAREKLTDIVKRIAGGQQVFVKADLVAVFDECEFLMNVCIHQAKVIEELEGEGSKAADRQGGAGPDSTNIQDGVEGNLGSGSGGSEEHAGTGPDSTVQGGTPDGDNSRIPSPSSSGIVITGE